MGFVIGQLSVRPRDEGTGVWMDIEGISIIPEKGVRVPECSGSVIAEIKTIFTASGSKTGKKRPLHFALSIKPFNPLGSLGGA
jgi:hypothetical protein